MATQHRAFEAATAAAQAHREKSTLAPTHLQRQTLLHGHVLGRTTPSALSRATARLRTEVERDRADLEQIEALPIGEAAKLVRDRAVLRAAEKIAAEQDESAREARARNINSSSYDPLDHDDGRRGPHRDSPTLGFSVIRV